VALADGAEIDDAGFLEHSQVFRGVILRHFEAFGEFVDAEIVGEERLDEPLAGGRG
jgi:hypothetical protein